MLSVVRIRNRMDPYWYLALLDPDSYWACWSGPMSKELTQINKENWVSAYLNVFCSYVGIFYYYNILVPTVHEKVYCRCHNPTFVTAKSDQNPDPPGSALVWLPVSGLSGLCFTVAPAQCCISRSTFICVIFRLAVIYRYCSTKNTRVVPVAVFSCFQSETPVKKRFYKYMYHIPMLWILKYFFRIRILGPVILNYGSGAYLDILWLLIKLLSTM